MAGSKIVYNLVTKKSHSGKPTIELMRQCLLSILDHATKALDDGINFPIDGINIPMIGSGLDELKFINDVFWLLSEVF